MSHGLAMALWLQLDPQHTPGFTETNIICAAIICRYGATVCGMRRAACH